MNTVVPSRTRSNQPFRVGHHLRSATQELHYTPFMAWHIVSGPDAGPWEGRDAVAWLWLIESEHGEQRTVIVEISGPAMASQSQALPQETAEARASRGRSEIERLLTDDDPPHRVTLGTMGHAEIGA